MAATILILAKEEAIHALLRRGLVFEGYEVETAEAARTGLALAGGNRPDLVVLDWMLPGMDGLEVCKRLRATGKVPILVLTAKDSVSARVLGLDAGADDYMVKPFNLDELLARIRALLRRTQSPKQKTYTFADLVLDTGTRRAERGDRVIDLTAKEYELLELFLRNPRQVLTREMIYDEVWGYDFGGESNIIEVYIRYLRQKLEEGKKPRLLHTVRGMGYVLREDE